LIIDPYNHRSLLTFLVYLNDEFEGVETHFYNDYQLQYQPPNPDNVIYTYKPKTGDLLVFNSEITHDAGTLYKGQKYIFRSEIMYETDPSQDPSAKKVASLAPNHDPVSPGRNQPRTVIPGQPYIKKFCYFHDEQNKI
jgi:hypothetical protein